MLGLVVLAVIALIGFCTSVLFAFRKMQRARGRAQGSNNSDPEAQTTPPAYERNADSDPNTITPGLELESNMSNFLNNCPVQASILRDHGLPDECSWCHSSFDDLDSVRMFQCKHAIHYDCAKSVFPSSEPRCVICDHVQEPQAGDDAEEKLPSYKESQKATKKRRRGLSSFTLTS